MVSVLEVSKRSKAYFISTSWSDVRVGGFLRFYFEGSLRLSANDITNLNNIIILEKAIMIIMYYWIYSEII